MQALAFAITAQKRAWVPPFYIYSMDSIVCKERSVNFVGIPFRYWGIPAFTFKGATQTTVLDYTCFILP